MAMLNNQRVSILCLQFSIFFLASSLDGPLDGPAGTRSRLSGRPEHYARMPDFESENVRQIECRVKV